MYVIDLQVDDDRMMMSVDAPQTFPQVTNTYTTQELARCTRVDARDKLTAISYTLFTGGSYFVRDGMEMERFYNFFAIDVRRGTVPAINEIHSIKFPMYADFDFRLPVPIVPRDAICRIVSIANEQIGRFFPCGDDDDDEARSFRCVVCSKSNGGVDCGEGKWKHGLHMHWPELILQVEQAFILRLSIIAGLDRHTDWTELMGCRRPEWSAIVDEGVYRRSSTSSVRSGGLRMIGAPKAKKCKACHKDHLCTECGGHNNRHIIDMNVYVPYGVLVGPRFVDDAALRDDVHALVMATTVRRDMSVQLTAGFTPYVGCPSTSPVSYTHLTLPTIYSV